MATMTLQAFSAELAESFGVDCTAVVLYGSAALRDTPEPGADFDLLIIVRRLQPDALRRCASTVQRWQAEGHRAPLILTEAEWRSSRDVFAMEHADILARHRVLVGALPALAPVRDDDLRRQLEYEAMGALVHLRRGVLAVGSDPLRTLELLTRVKGTVLALLRTVLRVHGVHAPDDAAGVIAQAAARAGFDPAGLLATLAHARGERSIPPNRAGETLDAVHLSLKQLVAHVDAMWHPDAPAID